jgi:tetratricopeptide (TPR) repeat protein
MLDLIPVFWLAEGYHRRSMDFAEQSQDPEAVSQAHTGLGLHKAHQGEWDGAIEFAQRAAEISRDAGDWHKWGFPAYFMFLTRFYQGDLARALAHSRELVRVGQERVDPQVQCWGLSVQGLVQQPLGQFPEATVALQEAIELAKAIPDHAFRISAIADLGRCYLRQGDLEGGLAMLQESHEFYAPYLGGDSYASLRNGLAEAYLLAAERGDKTERADWLKRARRACKDALRQGKAFRPGLPEAMRLQGTYDCLIGKPAAAQKWWQRSLALAEEMGQRYDLGVTHLEMGQRLGERAHLEHAEAILAEIGAEWDLTRVREAMQVIL